MHLRSLAPLLLALAALVSGCDANDTTGPTAGARTTPTYVEAVESLIRPASRMGQIVSGLTSSPPSPWPSEDEVAEIVTDARSRLVELRAIDLPQETLRVQRGRVVAGFTRIVGIMDRLQGQIARRDRPALRTEARSYFDAVRTLPSALAAPPPSP